MQFTAQEIKENQNRYTEDGYCPEGARLLKILYEEAVVTYQDGERYNKHLANCSKCRAIDESYETLPEPEEVK